MMRLDEDLVVVREGALLEHLPSALLHLAPQEKVSKTLVT